MIELDEGAKVLVMGPNWLGDCVMAEPAVRRLIEARPDLDVTLLVPEGLQDVYKGHPQIQKLKAYKDRDEHAGMFGRMRLRGELKGDGYDAALILRNSFGAAFDASRAGIPVRLGYASFPRSWFLTAGAEYPEDFKEQHRSKTYLDLLREAGVEGELPEPQVHVSDEDKAKAAEVIRAEGGEPAELLVAIHPGAAYGPAKMWGEDRYASLADRLIEEQNATVLLLGTRSEEELASYIIGQMRETEHHPGAVRNLTGSTSNIAQLAAVFANCQLAVGNDSGPIHLAAAVGTPSVAIFGSTSSDQTGLRNQTSANLWERFDCSPCFKRECPKEDYMACMDAIPVARVYTAVRELLGLEEPDFEEIERNPGDTEGVPDDGDH